MILFFAAFFIIAAAPHFAHAATIYYTATNGSDSNPGTLAAPFKTLQKAADKVQGGDTVLVHAGEYASFRVINLHPPEGQWITFKPAPGEKVIINTDMKRPDGSSGGFRLSGASYIIIDGFEIKSGGFESNYNARAWSCDLLNDPGGACLAKAKAWGPGGSSAIGIDSTYFGNANTDTHHIILRNNDIHHNGHSSIMAGTGAKPGTSGKGNYNIEITDNHIHHNGIPGLTEGYGTYVTGTNLVIRGNILHDNSGQNMRLGNTSTNNHLIDSIVEKNITYNALGPFYHGSSNTIATTAGMGIVVWGGEGNIVRNNIAYGNHGAGIQDNSINSAKPDMVYNNTVYGNDVQGLMLQNNAIAKNNISFGNAKRISAYELQLYGNSRAENNLIGGNSLLIDTGNNSIESNNIVTTDPKFANAAGADFHLTAASVDAIDKGVTLSEVNNDFDYGKRPFGAAYDIGAFEFGSTPGEAPGTPLGAGGESTGGSPGDLGMKDQECIPPGQPVNLGISVPAGATGIAYVSPLVIPAFSANGTTEKYIFTLNAGAPMAGTDGMVWEVPISALGGLTVTPPVGYEGPLSLSVSIIPPFQ